MNRWPCTLVVFAVLAMTVILCSCKQGSKRAAVNSRPLLAVHVAADDAKPPFEQRRTGPDGQAIFLDPTPLVTSDDVQRATRSTTVDGQPAVTLELTDAGAEKLSNQADSYLNRNLAVIWRDQVLCAPIARDALSRKLMIFNGGAGKLSEDQIDAMLKTLNHRGDAAEQ